MINRLKWVLFGDTKYVYVIAAWDHDTDKFNITVFHLLAEAQKYYYVAQGVYGAPNVCMASRKIQ